VSPDRLYFVMMTMINVSMYLSIYEISLTTVNYSVYLATFILQKYLTAEHHDCLIYSETFIVHLPIVLMTDSWSCLSSCTVMTLEPMFAKES